MGHLHLRRLAAALLLIAGGLAAEPVSAIPVPVTVTITSVECTQAEECDAAGIEAAGQSWPDFYARVFINGVPTDTPRAPDDQEKVQPFWIVSTPIDDAITSLVPITIQIWDHDSTSGDDIADASPQPGHNNLDLVLDVATGQWSGDTMTSCATGDGVDTDDDDHYPVRVCFDVSVDSASGDLDADGLLDGWERFGLDADGDGTIDVDLPAMGANPARQDLFWELDYEPGRAPTRDDINAVKAAFAVAPRPNPDGSLGITLHVDVGPLVDATADEAGRTGTCSNGLDDDGDRLADGLDPSCRFLDASREVGAGDCGNGVDDDGDGVVDAADPQCLVGDDLGGGQALTAPVGACNLDAAFAATKAANFNPNRAWVFRYAVRAAPLPPPPPPPPAGAPPPPPISCAGGWGEIGGNDVILFNFDSAGSLMHEFGHNLNLDHGGSNAMNCKPNYLSVMNYNLQFGIVRATRGTILDFSPPRIALDGSVRGVAPLASLVENALSETTAVDPTDGANQIVFMSGLGLIASVPASALPDWTGDATLPTAAGINIDTGIPATATTVAMGVAACANASRSSTLAGDDDWARVGLNLRQFGASAPGVLEPPLDERLLTDEEMEQLRSAILRTDLALALSASPDPALAGTPVGYAAVVTNLGPNPSAATTLDLQVLDGGGLFGTLPPSCVAGAPGTLSCDLGLLQPGEIRILDLSADVPSDLVHKAGAPLAVVAQASVADRAGNDGNPSNNAAVASVTAVAVADLSVADLVAPNPPLQMRVGEQVVVELLSTLGSAGPSSPMDAVLILTAAADLGATVSPTQLRSSQAALQGGEVRVVVNHPILLCESPGRHVFSFEQRIGMARAPDSDPNGRNDAAPLRLSVECLDPAASPPPPEPSEPPDPEPDTRAATVEALGQAGVDYSIAEANLLEWLSTSPPSTAYPAIAAVILQQGWHFRSPVALDVIVWYYENAPGAASPRVPEDVDVAALRAALLAASNERHGTAVTRFEDLLAPPR